MAEKTNFGQRSGDFPNQFAIGVNSSVKALSDFFGADNPVSQNLNKNIEWYRDLLSAQAQENEQEISRILEEAEGKGILEELGAGVSAFSVAPADFVANGLGSVATFAATGIAGKAVGFLKSAQVATGMGIGAGAVKGQIYETVKEEMINGGKSKEEAQEIAMEAQATFGKNLPSILVGSGLGAVNARTGAELIISKVLSKGGLEASASRVGNILSNGFMEGAPELAQSAQQKFSSNLALRQQGFDIPLTRGIYAEASLGGLSGMGLGALAGGVEPRVGAKQTLGAKDSKKLSVYFDLDETLIHAQNVHPESEIMEQRQRITLTDGDRSEHYDSLLRPHAKHMLAFCRELGEVKLLTTANRQYALEHNDAFKLGFNPDQIIARDDYISRTQLAYGSVYGASKENTDPSAFLIDNLYPTEDAPKLKKQFLGIQDDQYIQIREFNGKDPVEFTKELSDILNRLENHSKGVAQPFTQPPIAPVMPVDKVLEVLQTPKAPDAQRLVETVLIEPRRTPKEVEPEKLNLDSSHLRGMPDFSSRLASKLHETWVENYKKESSEKRFKPVGDPDFADLEIVAFKGKRLPKQDLVPSAKSGEMVEKVTEIRTKDGDRIDTTNKNLYDCQLVQKEGSENVGVLVQNIVQEPELINPALMHKLNGSISEKYLETIGPELMEMSKGDFTKCREDISSLVHDVWVEENKSWAPEEQKVPYNQLPEFEKEKGRGVADALMGTVQEIKTIEKLKGIEIESSFEPLFKTSQESVKRASDWIKGVDLCGKELVNSPWHMEATKTLGKIRESMSKEVYDIAYKEVEASILGGASKAPAKSKSRPKAMDYEPEVGM